MSKDADVGVDERPGTTVPGDIELLDPHGDPVSTADLFRTGRPVVMVLAYSDCPMLCNLVLHGLADAVRDAAVRPGTDYDPVTVSIDPAESPANAARAEKLFGWRYLRGQDPAIHRLADALGFRYRYDASSKQYIHPAVVFVLTPGGRIAQYLYGLRHEPGELDAAVRAARGGEISRASFFEAVLVCLRLDPTKRKYGGALNLALRSFAALMLAFALAFAVWIRRRRRTRP